ncbi:hypothetical protein PbB2_01459 [Candidatus Phycosocius bacilliformis]|uniref:DUF302 domain-containing protein n=1 Tax=Candidatus Phycosocius bacilliformis TaxID=1445552 RepID=A0A2P2E9P9_9PROT|nr:DUF302 domain-containing protein [Candidatus Phycosocius bacilliformis]GBF57789.1 hypothetical protein PbB2_01459 [Candidatus Phycosocius bacilliformis]
MKNMLFTLCLALSCAPLATGAATVPDPTVTGQTLLSPTAPAAGIVRVKSRYGMEETVRRLRADIAAKGIQFFAEIDQSQLGAGANIAIRPSRLILFGNPPLGVQFLSSNPYSGLDWPVRMLILEEADGSISVAWTDFAFIAERYHITDRGPQFAMASAVAASIASSTTQ